MKMPTEMFLKSPSNMTIFVPVAKYFNELNHTQEKNVSSDDLEFGSDESTSEDVDKLKLISSLVADLRSKDTVSTKQPQPSTSDVSRKTSTAATERRGPVCKCD